MSPALPNHVDPRRDPLPTSFVMRASSPDPPDVLGAVATAPWKLPLPALGFAASALGATRHGPHRWQAEGEKGDVTLARLGQARIEDVVAQRLGFARTVGHHLSKPL